MARIESAPVPTPHGALRVHGPPALVGIALLACYAAFAGRSVAAGDSGELAAAMTIWGVAHAPSFPLLVLAGNLVTHVVHVGEPAFVLNLMNALFASLACAVLSGSVGVLTSKPWAGAVAGLALGLSRVFWDYALVGEVFALNALMAALLLLFLACFLRGLHDRRPVLWPLPALTLVMTAVFTHHTTLVLVAAPVLLVVLGLLQEAVRCGVPPARLRRALVHAGLAGLAGLLLLAYVPIASQHDPLLNWGEVHDAGSFLHLLARRDFGSGVLIPPGAVVEPLMQNGEEASPLGLRHLRLLAADLPGNLGPAALLLALAGLVWVARRQPRLLWLVVLTTAAFVLFYTRVNAPVTPLFVGIARPFRILPHLLIAFLAGLGAARVLELGARRLSPRVVVPVLAVLVGAPLAVADLRDSWVRDDTFVRDLGAQLTAGLPRDAVLFVIGDLQGNALYYRQACLAERRDVTVVGLTMMGAPWYRTQLARRGRARRPSGGLDALNARALIDLNRVGAFGRERPVASTGFFDRTWRSAYRMVPMGLWSLMVPNDQPLSLRGWADAFSAAAREWPIATLERDYPPSTWQASGGVDLVDAIAALQVARDLADAFEPARASPPEVQALAVAARWSGARRAAFLSGQAEIWRLAVHEGLLQSGAAAESLSVARAMALTGESLAADSTNLRALITRAGLLRRAPGLRDPIGELRLRRRIVAQRPGDLTQLAFYFSAAVRVAADPVFGAAALEEAETVRRRYVALLGTASRLWDGPEIAALRDEWSTPLKVPVDERLANLR